MAFTALPKLMAFFKASLFKTGSAPGNAKQVGQTCVFGLSPKLVEHEQNIFVLVFNWQCTSKPIIISNITQSFLLFFNLKISIKSDIKIKKTMPGSIQNSRKYKFTLG